MPSQPVWKGWVETMEYNLDNQAYVMKSLLNMS